jgi:UrcA family protein
MFVRPSILAAAALVAGLLNVGIAAAPAFAQASDGIAVSYGDLNLGNAAGREILDRRIAGAAEQLCGKFSPVELNWAAAVQACRAETIALTLPQRNAAIGLGGTVQVSMAGQTLRVNRAAN